MPGKKVTLNADSAAHEVYVSANMNIIYAAVT
jgi:hypothetical protein